MIFDIRELKSIEMFSYCFNESISDPLRIDQRMNFALNYHLRIYTSDVCYVPLINSFDKI